MATQRSALSPSAYYEGTAQQRLDLALRRALAAAGADLAERDGGQCCAALLARLQCLSHHGQGAACLAFSDALQRAWERLVQEYSDPLVVEQLLLLLTLASPLLDTFRQAAIEELILSNQPNLGRLIDHYRREVRWLLPPQEANPLRWTTIEPVLRLFLQSLLPQELAAHPDLRALLPDAEERAMLDKLRTHDAAQPASGLARIEALLAELTSAPQVDQRIVASEGGTIAQVHQTIVVGQRGAPSLAPPDLAALYHRYQGFLIETFGLLDFRGIVQFQNVVRLRLDEVYVPLMGRRTSPGKAARPAAAAFPPEGLPGLMQRDYTDLRAPLPLHQFVRDLPFLVMLGDPGAGKSTLVRSILLAAAEGQFYQRFGLEGLWLAILFPVAAFAEARSTAGRHDMSPLDYLSSYYRGLSQPDYRPLFYRALATGRALVLFDGLDEVRGDRLALIRCLEAFVREWDAPGNRFIATSRIAGYDDAPLDDSLFLRVTIQPLDDDGIRAFITRWSSAYEQAGAQELPTDAATAARELQRRIESRAHDLSMAVFTNPNVTTLARSPLLLTILALIHHQGASLPDRRVDLYRLCVEALAETWNRARSLSGREVDVYLGSEKLDERFVVNLLGPAALWMQEHQPGGMVERSDLEQQIAHTLIQTDGLPSGRAQRLAQSFVDLVQRDTGLLQERGYQRYGFLHLTFEEYLAARAILESVTVKDPDALIHERCVDAAWREVLRLMVAAASQREAQRLLLHMLRAPTTPETCGRPVVLAGECLLDIGRNSATQRAWSAVIDELVVLSGRSEPTLATRLAGGHVLGQLGDPRLLDRRSGLALNGAPYWCRVSAGPFWYGSDRADQPLHQFTLPYDYAIARFPVTNAEYQCFIEAGGYQQRRWWTATGWAFLQPGRRSPADDQTRPITQPNHWQHPSFSGPNQPVVGVSWYEAAAYCAWLTEQGHRAGWLPEADLLRLPTSLEWERAARHTDQRRYPWGDEEPATQHASYDAAGLHAPAPIGCFPAGAAVCGALDLAGNVWEWTATLWERIQQPAPWSDFTAAKKPAIRGGAFNWSSGYLHCGAHYWFSPGYRQNLLGFRVVWCPQQHA